MSKDNDDMFEIREESNTSNAHGDGVNMSEQPPSGQSAAPEIVYRWHALDYSGYRYGSNPPDDLPARCNLTAFYRQPDAFREALHEISATGNLTATPEQFARHLQRIARDALAGVQPAAATVPADDLPKLLMEAARRDALTWADRVAIGRAIAALAAPAALQEPEWIDDPHDIEQGMMRNPKYAAPAVQAAPQVQPSDEELLEVFREACEYADRCGQSFSYGRAQALRVVLSRFGAAPQVEKEARPATWAEAETIANIPAVDEALATFSNDSTWDNAVGVVQAVLDALTTQGASRGE